jgi:hypothetical protein
VERMDGWMDEKSTRKNAEDDFLLRVKNLRYSEKACEIKLTRRGTCTGYSRRSSHTVTNGSKCHRPRRRNGLKVIYKKNPLPWCW